ncbi:MAG: hypothetical protein ACR2K3_10890 [Nocardioides sp.]
MSHAEAPRAGNPRAGVRMLAGAAVIALLFVAAAVYLRLGWSRMESSCTSTDAFGQQTAAVDYGWSWSPLGFQCAYFDGSSETSLWP